MRTIKFSKKRIVSAFAIYMISFVGCSLLKVCKAEENQNSLTLPVNASVKSFDAAIASVEDKGLRVVYPCANKPTQFDSNADNVKSLICQIAKSTQWRASTTSNNLVFSSKIPQWLSCGDNSSFNEQDIFFQSLAKLSVEAKDALSHKGAVKVGLLGEQADSIARAFDVYHEGVSPEIQKFYSSIAAETLKESDSNLSLTLSPVLYTYQSGVYLGRIMPNSKGEWSFLPKGLKASRLEQSIGWSRLPLISTKVSEDDASGTIDVEPGCKSMDDIKNMISSKLGKKVFVDERVKSIEVYTSGGTWKANEFMDSIALSVGVQFRSVDGGFYIGISKPVEYATNSFCAITSAEDEKKKRLAILEFMLNSDTFKAKASPLSSSIFLKNDVSPVTGLNDASLAMITRVLPKGTELSKIEVWPHVSYNVTISPAQKKEYKLPLPEQQVSLISDGSDTMGNTITGIWPPYNLDSSSSEDTFYDIDVIEKMGGVIVDEINCN